jgi:heparosan-N-sulfate-glucuronate 5-epimerase
MSLASNLNNLLNFFLSYFIPYYQYDYWHFPHYCSTRIDQGDYLINFIPKLNYSGPMDKDGVPLLDLSSVTTAKGNGVVLSPVLVSQYALGLYSQYLAKKNQALLPKFLQMADWLCDQAELKVHAGKQIALCHMDFGRGAVLSAMAQGQAISVWARAFQLTNKAIYSERAIQAYNLFQIPIESGGVVDRTPGFPVLEEWVVEPVHILNGHLFAFVGLHELLYMLAGTMSPVELAEVRDCYNVYLDSSIRLAAKIDMTFWTKYSLRDSPVPNIASFFYHHLHVELMKGLHILTRNKEFAYYEKRWRKQMTNSINKTWAMVIKLADKVIYFT